MMFVYQSLIVRDRVREFLEKDPAHRSDDDINVLLDFMQHLPVRTYTRCPPCWRRLIAWFDWPDAEAIIALLGPTWVTARVQQRIFVSEVAADWQELMAPRRNIICHTN